MRGRQTKTMPLLTDIFETSESICSLANFIIDRVAGAIIRLVASVCVCPFVCGTLLFEPFDL